MTSAFLTSLTFLPTPVDSRKARASNAVFFLGTFLEFFLRLLTIIYVTSLENKRGNLPSIGLELPKDLPPTFLRCYWFVFDLYFLRGRFFHDLPEGFQRDLLEVCSQFKRKRRKVATASDGTFLYVWNVSE